MTLHDIYNLQGKDKMFEEAQKRLTSKENVRKVFEEILEIGKQNLYTLMQWPDSQEFMDQPWFEDEAVCAVGSEDRFGSAAYFIPVERLNQSTHINESNQFDGFM
jgi:hypothetical protein